MAILLFILFIVITLINILFYVGFLKFATAKPIDHNPGRVPVSVIVCAKNEAENLKQFLPAILDQHYFDFEVILINDASIDDTLEVMEGFQAIDPRVQIVNVQNNEAFWGKKKYALTLGIKRAKNPYLLFTDADCTPETPSWIDHMASQFQNDTSIILGYGGYFKNKISVLNKLIRFETLFTAIQYFSYAQWGQPYMGVGRNLAYTSSLFFLENGFASHLHVRSGDDDLFVNQAATPENTAICFSPHAMTRSVPNINFSSWFNQKRRHISTSKLYKPKHKLLLGAFFFSQFFFWFLFAGLLLFQVYWQIVLAAFLVRILVQYVVFWQSAKKLNELDIVWMVPLLDFFLVFMQLGIFSINLVSKPSNWK